MSFKVDFNTVKLDIVDVLKSAATVGPIRGVEVHNYLNKTLQDIDEDTLLLIDLRKANPLQYNFCQHAFGPLLKDMLEKKIKKVFVMFQMHEYHKKAFFRGILKFIDIDLNRRDAVNTFTQSGMFTLLLNDKNEIVYVSSLSEIEERILVFLQKVNCATTKEIEEENRFQPEETVDSLRSLLDKCYVMRIAENLKYYSVSNFLK